MPDRAVTALKHRALPTAMQVCGDISGAVQAEAVCEHALSCNAQGCRLVSCQTSHAA